LPAALRLRLVGSHLDSLRAPRRAPAHPQRARAPVPRHLPCARGAHAPVRAVQRTEGFALRAVPWPRDRRTGAQAREAVARLLRRVLQDHQRSGRHASRVSPDLQTELTAQGPMTELRWSLPSAESLNELLAAPLPLGLRAGPTRRTFHRDLYFDTPDGDLRRRGATCRLRFHVD